MEAPQWTEVLSAIGGVLTPVAIVIFGAILTRRQSRNDLLLKARFDAYDSIVPDLNRLMCYMTFIGAWRELSPPEVVALKRRLDSQFFVVAPLFSPAVERAYAAMMKQSFATFGRWGQDALIRSSPYRRRSSWSRTDVTWDPSWDEMFELPDTATISGLSLSQYRRLYDELLTALVVDLDVTRARSEYTTSEVSMNASAPVRPDIEGATTERR